MPIPKIQAYSFSGFEGEALQQSIINKVEANSIKWPLDADKAVLLIHDMQNYFVNFYGENSKVVAALIKNIQTIKARCKSLGIPVVYTAQPENQTPDHRMLLTDFWGPGLQSGNDNQAIVPALEPDAEDICYTKWRYSAFQRTSLLEWMRTQQRNQLIIVGIYGHIGILATAMDAFMNDIQAFVIGDAIADFSLAEHEMALNYVASRCGVVKSSEQLLAELNSDALSFHQVKCLIAERINLPVDELEDDDNLMDLGLDSVTLMEMVEHWNQQGADLRFADVAEYATVQEWWELICVSLQKNTSSQQQPEHLHG